jgi:hypothetical protein
VASVDELFAIRELLRFRNPWALYRPGPGTHREMVQPRRALDGSIAAGRRLGDGHRVLVAAGGEEHHALFIDVRDAEVEDLRVELGRSRSLRCSMLALRFQLKIGGRVPR